LGEKDAKRQVRAIALPVPSLASPKTILAMRAKLATMLDWSSDLSEGQFRETNDLAHPL
jgi:hypothetical protein